MDKELPLSLTVRQAAVLAGIGINRMYEVVNLPGFPRIKLGGKIIIMRDPFIAWLNEQALAHADIAV
ncbi:MAG: helix-turn-helix domain-containing protein [Alicyclobacillus sp.]|nr:helix-turn-helix domain-containing protein [Alicyclobacillus sp.]